MNCTPHRAHLTRATHAYFSRVAQAQDVWVVLCLVISWKNHSISSMFRGTLLDTPFSSPFSTPFPTLALSPMTTPSQLYPSASSTSARTQGGCLFGRLAEQAPLTGCLTESVWTHITKSNMLTPKTNSQTCWRKAISPVMSESSSPFVQHHELFDVLSQPFQSNLNLQPSNHVEEADTGRKTGEEERVWRNRNQWWDQCRRLPIGLQQHWVRVHQTALGHSEHRVRIQTVLVRGERLREVWMKPQHRVLKCGTRMQTRLPALENPWRKRQRELLVQRYLTTTSRYPILPSWERLFTCTTEIESSSRGRNAWHRRQRNDLVNLYVSNDEGGSPCWTRLPRESAYN